MTVVVSAALRDRLHQMMEAVRIGIWGTSNGVRQWLSPTVEAHMDYRDGKFIPDRDISVPVTKNSLDAALRIESIKDPAVWIEVEIANHPMVGSVVDLKRDRA